jgi:hypothetical protein
MSFLGSIPSSYLQSVLGTALQGTGLTTKTNGNSLSGIGQTSDNSQLSPFAQMLSTLQQLQQSDPAKYKQVTSQIAANLQNAANTATANGNTTQAGQLNQLATDFTNASQNNTLPNVQDLAQAISGGHMHHHHHHAAPSSSDSSASSATSPNNLSQLISAFSANSTSATGNTSLDPLSIITSTLSGAGISMS